MLPWSATAQQPEIAASVAFTEGPAADREGNVYFTDIISQRIMKLGRDGLLSTYRENGNVANGLLIDPEGNLYASAGLNQLRGTSETLDTRAGVYVISPEGKLLTFVPIPEDLITNNAFGGADMKTLYVTAGKTLYTVRMEIAGLPR